MRKCKNQRERVSEDTPNKSMDVRAKQRLSYQSCVVNFTLCGSRFAPRHLNRSTFLGKFKHCEIVAGKYHSPKEYQDAAKSPETPASELAFLAKSEYNFVRLAVAQNPNVTAEILASLVPDKLDSWNEQDIARALTRNKKTSLETLSLLAEKLIPVLDSGRDNDLGLEAGIYLCNNPNTPFEAIEKIMASEKASTLFRRKVASKSRRKDVLELLLTDRSEAVRKRAANNLEFLRQSTTA